MKEDKKIIQSEKKLRIVFIIIVVSEGKRRPG